MKTVLAIASIILKYSFRLWKTKRSENILRGKWSLLDKTHSTHKGANTLWENTTKLSRHNERLFIEQMLKTDLIYINNDWENTIKVESLLYTSFNIMVPVMVFRCHISRFLSLKFVQRCKFCRQVCLIINFIEQWIQSK